MNIKPLMTSKSDNWATPFILYDFIVNKLKYSDLFPYCSTYDQYENKEYFDEKLFINPPFSEINKVRFSDYIDLLVRNGNKLLILIPSRTDTKIFHKLMSYGATLYFFEGRLHFNDSDKPSTFPSCLLYIHRSLFNFNVYKFGNIKQICNLIKNL